ncbi:MAG: CpsD/CapB family tyrosine-protein kinase [Saccharofermentanales bacterium]
MSDMMKDKRGDRDFHKKKASAGAGNRFSVVEAYKTIRTNLQFSFKKKTGNVVVITSTLPRDGKSTVVANISVAFAQTGTKVLVIDCDMRKPRINKFFNIASTPGLSNVLAGLSPLADVIQTTSYPNLSIIASGILPPNPAELISGSVMEDLVEKLRGEFDVIVVDTPPVNIVSDAVVATKFADGVVIVARHVVTTHPELTKAIKSFEFVDAKIFGIILNAVDYSKIYGKRHGGYGQKAYGKNAYGKGSGYEYASHSFDNELGGEEFDRKAFDVEAKSE